MIVEMKKVSLIVLDRHRESVLSALRKTGIVHVESAPVVNKDIASLERRLSALQQALEILPRTEVDPGPVPHLEPDEVASSVRQQDEENRETAASLAALNAELKRAEPLGEFSPEDIAYLGSKGQEIRLYEVSNIGKHESELPGSVFVIHRDKVTSYIASIGGEVSSVHAREFELPEKSTTELKAELAKAEARYQSGLADLSSMNRYRSVLESGIHNVLREIEFETVKSGMEQDDALALLKGYAPVTKLGELKNAAAANGWGLLLRDPEPEDAVPSLIKTSKPISLIKPIFQLIGIIPGYREFDISVPFLLFFTVFFAMIIGDGGYGLVFLAGSVYALIKSVRAGRQIPKAIGLFLVLSAATVIWGAITGTWFGSSYLASLPFLEWMVIPQLSSFDPQSSLTIKWLCFIIGTVHISIARLWSFVRELKSRPFIKAFTHLGWLSTVLGLYYLVLNIVLDPVLFPVPLHALYMIGGGIVGVILFSEQDGNFFKGLARGFGGFLSTFLDSIGAFSDIVSYIRLFAVGLATIEIAKAFNAMASEMATGIVGIVAAVVILFIGHSLNVAMGALSVIVHGVRLNILEFSGHLSMEWTGFEYKPFGDESGEE